MPLVSPTLLDPYTHTPLLALAISWAPVSTVRELLRAGADPNFVALDGFPALVGAVMAGRDDTHELLQVLISGGAELDRQGINGWTALHAAATLDDVASARVLLARLALTRRSALVSILTRRPWMRRRGPDRSECWRCCGRG